jgi:protein-arginine kinase activator protein McsA
VNDTGDISDLESSKSLEERDIQELERMLKEAVNSENYELASQIRDELNRRK